MEEKLFNGKFFQSLNRIRLSGQMRMNAGMSGSRRSTAKGSSVEFSDFREYLPGDDIRRIDWNAYGRLDRLFVKLFMQEKEGMYTVLIDNSSSMKFGSPSKAVMASRLAGALGYMAMQSLDRVRLVTVQSGETVTEKSVTGRQSLQKYLEQIDRVVFQGGTRMYESVRKIPFTRRGMTIILSDFMEEKSGVGNMEAIHQMVRYLRYQRQDVLLVQILSPEEIEPETEGTICLVDEETGEELKITMTGRLRKEYLERMKQYQSELQKLAKKYQAYYMRVNSADALDQVIYQGIRSGRLEQI